MYIAPCGVLDPPMQSVAYVAENYYQNNILKLYIDTSICLQEVDPDWNISWPLATRGEVVIQKCPGGAESVGMHWTET